MLMVGVAVAFGACRAVAQESMPLDVAALASHTSPFQAKILKDGKVTASEYESAILGQRACVQASGGTVSEISRTGNNELAFRYTIDASTDAELAGAERRSEACIPKYISEVGKAWAYEQRRSPLFFLIPNQALTMAAESRSPSSQIIRNPPVMR
ncbi:hypothetical protein LK09_01805 [Microbacterium mangrovi]|uniref:Uncharacterized protein n=1 Tax=Microbacterium mangrovi TaxID=1348253 RepID=A0A0B2ACW6_9MICO|nr:hypothetical protein [Microbacterium mangrovi]KHK99422.1 hypothetical protein LK09_01805 [Microbacterium mangrovi]